MGALNATASVINSILGRAGLELVRRSESWNAIGALGRQPVSPASSSTNFSLPYYKIYADQAAIQDRTFGFSVVMPSILRDTLPQALRSVFTQDLPGPIETLVGVDVPRGDLAEVGEVCRLHRPPNHLVVLFNPGHSTSVRHGGLHPAWDGGALRTILSYLARSRRVAYLDDDNWWQSDHLSSLASALAGRDWAWSNRWFVHPTSRRPICRDDWESVGPGDCGVFSHLGGWVDPNCLAIDKIACESVLRWWGIPLRNSRTGTDADRNVFRILSRNFRGRGTGRASVFYTVNENDPEHSHRVACIGAERYHLAATKQLSPHMDDETSAVRAG